MVQVVTGNNDAFQFSRPSSSAVLSEADVRKGSTWHAGGGASKLYLLCNNGHVQYFGHTKEDTVLIKKLFLPVAIIQSSK